MIEEIDKYEEGNQDNFVNVGDPNNVNLFGSVGQSFTNIAVSTIDSCKFYLKKSNSPTGDAVAKLYSHVGTYGSTSVTGLLLATSDNFDVSTLAASYQLITFNFTGANRVKLDALTPYCIVFEYGAGDATNKVTMGTDTAGSSNHSGNMVYFYNGGWGFTGNRDIVFYVYGVVERIFRGILNFLSKNSPLGLFRLSPEHDGFPRHLLPGLFQRFNSQKKKVNNLNKF